MSDCVIDHKNLSGNTRTRVSEVQGKSILEEKVLRMTLILLKNYFLITGT